MPEPSGPPEATSDTRTGGRRAPPPRGDPAEPAAGGDVFTAPERERLRTAFRAGNGAATAAELAAFVAWARGVRVEGGLLTLILQGLALPIRPQEGGGYRFRATADAAPPG